MAKKEKVWRVKPEYVGRVTIEQECNHVVLTNLLAQDQLIKIAKNEHHASFLEQVTTQTENTDGE